MKIGISRPSHSSEEARHILEMARALGFAGVQLKPAQYQMFLNSADAFRERYGSLSDMAAGGLIYYPGNVLESWEQQLSPVIAFAKEIAAPHICLCSGIYASGATEADVQAVAQTLTRVGTEARKQNVAISIHNHVASIVESEEDIARLLEKLDPPVCGLTLDTAHAAKAGIKSVAQLARRFQKHLLNIHLKDLATDGTFCPLGRGTLPMDSILEAIHEIAYDEWLIVDEETASLSSHEALQLSGEFLRQRSIL